LASLNDLVHQLARPHKTMIERDGGARESVDVLPLLQQLRYACKQDSRGGASGHSTGPSAPLALQATMDYRAIQAVIQEWHVHITGQNYGSIEQQLITWAAWAQSPAILALEPNNADDCMVWCRGWVEKIRTTLHPVRKGEIPGACPECEATEAWDNIDGERTRIGHAIAALGGVAKCLNCGTTWMGKDLHALAAKMRAAENKSYLQLEPA
jgi:hypothetical protein